MSSAWRQQRCAHCHTVYRFLVRPDGRRRAVPCPTCERVQPDVCGRRGARGHRRATILTLVGLIAPWVLNLIFSLLLTLGNRPLHVPPQAALPAFCALVGVIGWLGHLGSVVVSSPWWPLWNGARVARLRKQGVLVVDQQGLPAGHDSPLRPARVGMVLCTVGMLSLLAGAFTPRALAWPVSFVTYPSVVSPGDTAMVIVAPPARIRPDERVSERSLGATLQLAFARKQPLGDIELALTAADGQHLLVIALAPPMAGALYVWCCCRLASLIGLLALGFGGHALMLASRDLARQAHPASEISFQKVPTPLRG